MESYKKDYDAELAAKPAEYDPKKKTWHKEQMKWSYIEKAIFEVWPCTKTDPSEFNKSQHARPAKCKSSD